MRILLYIIAIGLFLSLPVHAQQLTVEADCIKASQYKSGGAEYVPGVDVNGNPVVGADVAGSFEGLNYPLVIPVEIDAVRFLDLDVPPGIEDSGELQTDVAYFTLFEDGRVEYNGQDVSSTTSIVCIDPAAQTVEAPVDPAVAEPASAAPKAAPVVPAAAPPKAEAAPQPKAEVQEPEARAPPTTIEPVKEVKPDGQAASNAVPSAAEKETAEEIADEISETEFNKLINNVTNNEQTE